MIIRGRIRPFFYALQRSFAANQQLAGRRADLQENDNWPAGCAAVYCSATLGYDWVAAGLFGRDRIEFFVRNLV